MVAIALYSIATLWGGFAATTPVKFTIAFVLHGVISGCYFTTSASLQQRLFPRSRFAQFASAATMLIAISTMVLGPIVGTFLDYTHHVYRYTFLMDGVIAVLCLLAFAVVHRGFMHLGGPKGYVAPGDTEAEPAQTAM